MISTSETDLRALRFLGVSGAVTVKGYFCDAGGYRTGNSFSSTINASGGAPKGFADFAGSVPADAQFARVVLSGDVYMDASSVVTDFQSNPTNYPVALALPTYNAFGRGAN